MSKRRIWTAYLLTALFFLSSVGMGVYRRWCSCQETVFYSVLRANEGTCCKHKHQHATTKKSCCTTKTSHCEWTSEKAELPADQPRLQQNCCSTNSDFWVAQSSIPTEIQPEWAAPSIDNLPFLWALPIVRFAPTIALASASTFQQTGIPAPPLLRSGRDRLQWMQLLRC